MGGLSALGRLLSRAGRGVAYYPVGGSCCLPELAGGEPAAFVRAEWARAASPRQADLLLVVGPINAKLGPLVAAIYGQLPEPRRVLLVGSCFRAGYTRAADSDGIFEGAPRVAGCPADPAAVIAAARALPP